MMNETVRVWSMSEAKMKRFLLILTFICFFVQGKAFSANPPMPVSNKLPQMKTTLPPISAATSASPVQPQPVDFTACSKFFKIDSQKLFYLTLAGINANRFTIDEIQSKSGYILFTVVQKHFLASVITVDSKTSMLKITPCNNVYYFPVGIVQNMFKYVELNISTPVEKLTVVN